jgi:hypothetical protein
MTKAEKITRFTCGATSDGSTAAYYELPLWARELADLIRYKKMNGSQAEMFRALYRGNEASHSGEYRQARKLLAYAVDEMVRTHFPEHSFAAFRDKVFDVFEDDHLTSEDIPEVAEPHDQFEEDYVR